MGQQSALPRRFIVPVVLAVLASGAVDNGAAMATEPPAACATGKGLVVLMGQDDLYLNQPSGRATASSSVLKSIVASALTGGSYLVGFYPGSDRGSLIAAPRSQTADFQPAAIAQSLAREISATPAAESFDMFAPTTRGEDVDELLWNTTCASVVVVNAQYTLENSRVGVQLSLVAQVLSVPARRPGEGSTIAALEYRSSPLVFAASASDAALAAELERLLAEQHATIAACFREASAEVASMVSSMLQSGPATASSVPLGKALRQLQCDDCTKSDLVIAATPARLWIQPANESRVVKSLPTRPRASD